MLHIAGNVAPIAGCFDFPFVSYPGLSPYGTLHPGLIYYAATQHAVLFRFHNPIGFNG